MASRQYVPVSLMDHLQIVADLMSEPGNAITIRDISHEQRMIRIRAGNQALAFGAMIQECLEQNYAIDSMEYNDRMGMTVLLCDMGLPFRSRRIRERIRELNDKPYIRRYGSRHNRRAINRIIPLTYPRCILPRKEPIT